MAAVLMSPTTSEWGGSDSFWTGPRLCRDCCSMLLNCVIGCVGRVMSCDISTYKGYAEANAGNDN